MLSFDNFVVEMRSRDGRVVFLDVLRGIRLYTALAFKFRSSALLSSVSGSDTRMKMPFDAAFLTTNTHSGFPLYRPQSCLSKYNAHLSRLDRCSPFCRCHCADFALKADRVTRSVYSCRTLRLLSSWPSPPSITDLSPPAQPHRCSHLPWLPLSRA